MSLPRAWGWWCSQVSAFCARHQLPPSAAFLRVLAAAGDWVGLLWQAAVQGPSVRQLAGVLACVPDAHLRHHLAHVLRRGAPPRAALCGPLATSPRTPRVVSVRAPFASRTARRGSGSEEDAEQSPHTPRAFSLGAAGHAVETEAVETEAAEAEEGAPELFALVGRCERRADGGRTLLAEAVRWRWPLLAVVGACMAPTCTDACLLAWLQASAPGPAPPPPQDDVQAPPPDAAWLRSGSEAMRAQLQVGRARDFLSPSQTAKPPAPSDPS